MIPLDINSKAKTISLLTNKLNKLWSTISLNCVPPYEVQLYFTWIK